MLYILFVKNEIYKIGHYEQSSYCFSTVTDWTITETSAHAQLKNTLCSSIIKNIQYSPTTVLIFWYNILSWIRKFLSLSDPCCSSETFLNKTILNAFANKYFTMIHWYRKWYPLWLNRHYSVGNDRYIKINPQRNFTCFPITTHHRRGWLMRCSPIATSRGFTAELGSSAGKSREVAIGCSRVFESSAREWTSVVEHLHFLFYALLILPSISLSLFSQFYGGQHLFSAFFQALRPFEIGNLNHFIL